jgi:ATP-dependent Lon protease
MTSSNGLAYDTELVRHTFGALAIDKDRLPSSGLTAMGVPSFVAEWLLDKVVPGRGPISKQDHEKLMGFVSRAFPRKDDKQEIFFRMTQGEVCKLIALIQVRVKLEQNAKSEIPDPTARIPILNLEDCEISADIIQNHLMLLRHGVWGKVSLALRQNGAVQITDFDPFQCSEVDLSEFADRRSRFDVNQWRDLLLCSMGFNPEHPAYTLEAKTWTIARLLPIVESNFSVMELAPKGTGKSFVFENISNKVAVVSGGKITAARLFIDGRTKEIGLLGRHDVVVLDEVQSLTFDNPDEIIGPLKTYLANGRYNRSGFQEIASDCSLVMLANIELDEQQRPRNQQNILSDLPPFLHETAFLDRFAGIIPGWLIPKFNRDMVATQAGLKMDFFGEAMFSLRRAGQFMSFVQNHTAFDDKTTIRDQKAVMKTASGFLKLLYPHLQLTLQDFKRDCLDPAVQLRQQIRNLLYTFDDEFKQYGRYLVADVKE